MNFLIASKSAEVIPQREARRPFPCNISSTDEGLFAHELQTVLPPVKLYFLRWASIHRKNVYAGLPRRPQRHLTHPWLTDEPHSPKPPLLLKRQIAPSDSAVLITDHWSSNYFHWMIDALPRLLVAREEGVTAPVVVPEYFSRQKFVQDSLDFLKVPYFLARDDQITLVKRLTGVTQVAPTGHGDPNILNKLRLLIEATVENSRTLEGSVAPKRRRLWVSRDGAAYRKISNEANLLPVLSKYGFEVICSEDFSFEEQMVMFSGAEVVAGIHGAGLTNMLVAQTGAQVLEIRRRGDAHNNCYFTLAAACGHSYWYLEADEEEPGARSQNLSVGEQELSSVLGKIDAIISASGR